MQQVSCSINVPIYLRTEPQKHNSQAGNVQSKCFHSNSSVSSAIRLSQVLLVSYSAYHIVVLPHAIYLKATKSTYSQSELLGKTIHKLLAQVIKIAKRFWSSYESCLPYRDEGTRNSLRNEQIGWLSAIVGQFVDFSQLKFSI